MTATIARSVTMRGGLTPDKLPHLADEELLAAVETRQFAYALHYIGEMHAYWIPYGTGAYGLAFGPHGTHAVYVSSVDLAVQSMEEIEARVADAFMQAGELACFES